MLAIVLAFCEATGIDVAILQAIDTTCSISKNCMHRDIPSDKSTEWRANRWAYLWDHGESSGAIMVGIADFYIAHLCVGHLLPQHQQGRR